LIKLNKHYQKLERLYDLLTEAEEIVFDLDTLDLDLMDQSLKSWRSKYPTINIDNAAKALKTLLSQVSTEQSLTGMKSREIFAFQKLGKAISIYKSL